MMNREDAAREEHARLAVAERVVGLDEVALLEDVGEGRALRR